MTESLMNEIQPILHEYLVYLQQHPDGEEIQYRTALENLVKGLSLPEQNIKIIQEDRHSGTGVEGVPDFFVYENYGTPAKTLKGFIECKKPSYKLDKLIESQQIKNYSKTCENIILTNYHRFILLQKGKIIHHIELTDAPTDILDFGTLLRDFYEYEYPFIKTKKH
ncbi:MAG: hypothetical protein LBR36_05270 [Bacteroidales bacterium]|jgi:hypothetical protein|nr:hypothetical protein [Bacteroidales bacterium]